MFRSVVFWALVILDSGLSLGMYWFTEWPLGVPGEWVWGRFEITPDLLANALTCLVTGGLYLAMVTIGYRRLSRVECRQGECCAWLIGLAVMASVWIGTVQGTGTTGPSIGRWPFVLYYPSSSGYFFKARYETPSARELLKNYESLMREGDVLHVGTHPPGLFLFFHGLIALVDSVPGLDSAINATEPEAVREAFQVLDQNRKSTPSAGTLLTSKDQAVLWLAALIGFGLCAATVWPIYGFARQSFDRSTSWLTACTWPLIPGISMFLPKSDVAYAFLAALLGWLWMNAWRRQSIVLAGLAGLVWSISVLCSLAFLPVALWLALWSLFDSWPALRQQQVREEVRRAVRTIVPAGVVGLALMTAISTCGGIHLGKTFWLNYQNHAGFYAQYPRTYFAWLAVNPVELAGAMGMPLFVLSATAIGAALIIRPTDTVGRWVAPCLATVVVWSWLWISGKNSGEAARLWIFLFPYLAVSTASLWASLRDTDVTHMQKLPAPARFWFACQLLVCFWTVQRVNGFAN